MERKVGGRRRTRRYLEWRNSLKKFLFCTNSYFTSIFEQDLLFCLIHFAGLKVKYRRLVPGTSSRKTILTLYSLQNTSSIM